MRAWIEVSEDRLAENFRAVAEAIGADTDVLAVVKANAYGHGADVCSVALARAGAGWLGVTDASEGALVRQALGQAGFGGPGPMPRVLVLCGFLPGDVDAMEEHGLTPVVWTSEQVGWLRGASSQPMRVHVEVDTGMDRQGIRPGAELDTLLDALGRAGLTLDGIFTHFCSSEAAHSELTRIQQQRFGAAIAQVLARGLKPGWVHAGNSSSVDNPARDLGPAWLVDLAKSVGARAMVRSGLALYGYCLPVESPHEGRDARVVAAQLRPALKPVMQWKTRVLALRELAAGETVGYGATFTAPGPMRLALLPVGYADGLRRELSGSNQRPGGWVMVRGRDGADQRGRGRRADIAGRVSMNLTTVDVSGIEGVQVGDEVALLGDGITAEDHARLAGTIPYEILCGVRVG